MSLAIGTDQRVEWVAVSSLPQRLFALVPTGAAAASSGRAGAPAQSWAASEIRTVTAAGLMGNDAAGFRPQDPLTAQELEDLVFGLKQTVFPPAAGSRTAARRSGDPEPDGAADLDDTRLDDDSAADDDRRRRRPRRRRPRRCRPRRPPRPRPPRCRARRSSAAQPNAPVTMTRLDMRLVQALGLAKAANEFAEGARAAGLKVPARFGTEVVARLLGLRTNHPAPPRTRSSCCPATTRPAPRRRTRPPRCCASPAGRSQASRASPTRSACRRSRTGRRRSSTPRSPGSGCRTSGAARATAPRPISASPSRGGYDCSGFVWRVYKLQQYPSERLAAARAPRPDDLPDERRGARLEADRLRRSPARRRALLRRRRARARSRPRSTTRASTSATAGSSSRPATASLSRRSTAGTSASSPGPAGRSPRPACPASSSAFVHFRGTLPPRRTITPSGDSTERAACRDTLSCLAS